ncbi:MAG: nitroreductase family protein [bacterium]|jgi:nitroreductase|nr:nitroreductase family protein [bacterium]
MITLHDFESLVKTRRSVRDFKPDPIPDELLMRLLDITHWAPSGYNLQPTHCIIVDDPDHKKRLHQACMGQRQILQAPVVVVFTGDRRVYQNNFERVVEQEKNQGAMNEQYEKIYRKFVKLAFSPDPAGLGWAWKSSLLPIVNQFKPIPQVPVVHKRYWLAKQVMLNAMVFMLAAHAAGLATVPMEGFAEKAVKQVLHIPASHIVPLLIPVGYAEQKEIKKTRLPLDGFIHRNGW